MYAIKFLQRLCLLVIIVSVAGYTNADCLKDLSGEIFCGAGNCVVGSRFVYDNKYGTVLCSKYYQGGATKTLDGHVLCGKGDCAKSRNGEVFCSSVVGGSVLKDSKGNVRCYGTCEPASLDNCESTKAGSSANL